MTRLEFPSAMRCPRDLDRQTLVHYWLSRPSPIPANPTACSVIYLAFFSLRASDDSWSEQLRAFQPPPSTPRRSRNHNVVHRHPPPRRAGPGQARVRCRCVAPAAAAHETARRPSRRCWPQHEHAETVLRRRPPRGELRGVYREVGGALPVPAGRRMGARRASRALCNIHWRAGDRPLLTRPRVCRYEKEFDGVQDVFELQVGVPVRGGGGCG